MKNLISVMTKEEKLFVPLFIVSFLGIIIFTGANLVKYVIETGFNF